MHCTRVLVVLTLVSFAHASISLANCSVQDVHIQPSACLELIASHTKGAVAFDGLAHNATCLGYATIHIVDEPMLIYLFSRVSRTCVSNICSFPITFRAQVPQQAA